MSRILDSVFHSTVVIYLQVIHQLSLVSSRISDRAHDSQVTVIPRYWLRHCRRPRWVRGQGLLHCSEFAHTALAGSAGDGQPLYKGASDVEICVTCCRDLNHRQIYKGLPLEAVTVA